MTDNNKSGSEDWGSRQERKTVEKLKGAGVAIVIIVLYNLLDPKHILLEYLSVLLYKVSVLWSQFVLLTQRNWLIYLIGLFSAWIVIALLQKFFAVMSLPKEGGQNPGYGVESGFWEKWGGRIIGNLIVIFDAMKSFLVWVIVLYVIFAAVLLDPIGELFGDLQIYYSRFVQNQLWLLNGICGLVAIGVIWFAISSIKGHFSVESKAQRKRPMFFEEMQDTLMSILNPMGFEEKEGPAGLTRAVTFSRDQLIVSLWYDVRDQIYFVDASSKYSFAESENAMEAIMAKSKVGGEFDQTEYAKFSAKDFSVDGAILDADTFKNNAISKLHRWLAEHNISKGSEYLAENKD
jgi:hypothetical protein